MNYFLITIAIGCVLCTQHINTERSYIKNVRYLGLTPEGKELVEQSTAECVRLLGTHEKMEELDKPPNPLFQFYSGAYYKCTYEHIGVADGTFLNLTALTQLYEPTKYAPIVTKLARKCWDLEILASNRDLFTGWHYAVMCMRKGKHREFSAEVDAFIE